MEPVLERVVFEDMPANLAAIKRHVEAREVTFLPLVVLVF